MNYSFPINMPEVHAAPCIGDRSFEPILLCDEPPFYIDPTEGVWSRCDLSVSFTIDDQEFKSIEHFYQAQKYNTGESDFVEKIRLCSSCDDIKVLLVEIDHPVSEDWNSNKKKVMEQALLAKITQHPELQNLLLATFPADIIVKSPNEYWGSGDQGYGQNEYGMILHRIRQTLQNTSSSLSSTFPRTPKGKNGKYMKRTKGSPFMANDGSSLFEMASSSTVKVSQDDSIVISMSALPSKAKSVTKNFQYYKKKHPEAFVDEEDDSDEEIDSDCEEFIFHRPTEPLPDISTSFDASIYSDVVSDLLLLGFEDTDAIYAALLQTNGNFQSTLDILTQM